VPCLFEGSTKPALTEAQKTLAKKREELARVLENYRRCPTQEGREMSERALH
jgi:hypothetical protein